MTDLSFVALVAGTVGLTLGLLAQYINSKVRAGFAARKANRLSGVEQLVDAALVRSLAQFEEPDFVYVDPRTKLEYGLSVANGALELTGEVGRDSASVFAQRLERVLRKRLSKRQRAAEWKAEWPKGGLNDARFERACERTLGAQIENLAKKLRQENRLPPDVRAALRGLQHSARKLLKSSKSLAVEKNSSISRLVSSQLPMLRDLLLEYREHFAGDLQPEDRARLVGVVTDTDQLIVRALEAPKDDAAFSIDVSLDVLEQLNSEKVRR